MTGKAPLALLPGLLCDAALWRPQVEALADFAEPWVADLTTQDSTAAMAESVLAAMPDRFALAGLSMGGYVALEIMARAPERVTRLALLDTRFHTDCAAAAARRRGLLELARTGQFQGELGIVSFRERGCPYVKAFVVAQTIIINKMKK